MHIALRLLDKKDAAKYRALRLKSFQESDLAFSRSYEDEKHKTIDEFAEELIIRGNPPEWFVIGAFTNDDRLVGMVRFRRDLRTKARHKSMLHTMYVDPEFRNCGLGRRIVLDLLERVRRLEGLEQIHLWVLHADGSASGFYKKFGFISQGPFVKKDLKVGDVYVDAEYMVLYLEAI